MTNNELTIKSNFLCRNIYPATIDALAPGRIDVKSMISRYCPLKDNSQAFDDCIEQKASMVKAVINFDA